MLEVIIGIKPMTMNPILRKWVQSRVGSIPFEQINTLDILYIDRLCTKNYILFIWCMYIV